MRASGLGPRASGEVWRVLALLVAVAGTARAETRPRYGGTLEGALLGAPASLDPALARTHAEITAASLIYDTLYRLELDGTTTPVLATDAPAPGAEPLVLRIPIRKGVTFHDGAPLTPADVAASLERARAATPWLLAPVSDITSDADAVTLTLSAPLPELPALLALPEAAITEGGRAPGAHPIGTGPFEVAQFDPAHHRLELRAFDDSFEGRPYVDQLALRWYDTPDGEVRRFAAGAAQLSARGTTVFAGGIPAYAAGSVRSVAAVLAFVGFGRAHAAITGDVAFRRALDLALPRGGLVNTVSSGEQVVPTRLPILARAGDDAMDLAGAEGQLAAAASRVPALAPGAIARLRLEILVEDTRPDDRELAGRVVLALDQLGIAATITPVPAATLRARAARGDCDLWIGQLALPPALTRAWWGAAFEAGHDASLLPLLAAGALDDGAAEQRFEADLPIVPVMFRAVLLWFRSDVHGVALDALARPDFADMFLFGAPHRGHR